LFTAAASGSSNSNQHETLTTTRAFEDKVKAIILLLNILASDQYQSLDDIPGI